MAISMALSNLGARKIDSVSHSKEVIRRLENKTYDVIICDYTFGGSMDGLALLQELNQRRLIKPGAVFIIVTTERNASTVIAALDYAPDDYLLKPFTANVLMDRLEKAINRRPVFAAVQTMIQNHDYPRAIAECDARIAEDNVHKLDFMKIKGRLSLLTSDYEGAQKLYEQVLETTPTPWATMGLGKSLQNQEEYDKAIELFQSVISENSCVMEAYDLLADSHKAKGDAKVAQGVLEKAVAIVPNDLKRQQKLGEVAWENGDFEVAERTFRQCLVLGKEQAPTDPDNHIKLCKLMLDKGDIEAAQATMQEFRKAFPREPKTALYAALIEAMITQKSGEAEKAQEQYAQVKKDFEAQEGEQPDNLLLDMITAGLIFADDASAEAIVRKMLKNSTEGDPVRGKIKAIYEKEGKGEQIKTLIEAIMTELIALNNRAVVLAKGGDLKGAVELFIQAVADMPRNVRFIVNASNAMLAYVNLVGWDEAYMKQVGGLIARVAELEPTNPAYLQLTKMAQATTKKFEAKPEGKPEAKPEDA